MPHLMFADILPIFALLGPIRTLHALGLLTSPQSIVVQYYRAMQYFFTVCTLMQNQCYRTTTTAQHYCTDKRLSNPDDTRRLLLQTFVAQPCCGTFVARLSWAVAELHNKLHIPNLNSNLL